jgi:hypothetical protein
MERPHKQAEHMAAPTNAVQKLQKILANGEPSTHGLQYASGKRFELKVESCISLERV